MQNTIHKIVSFLFVVLAIATFGCASAVDDSSPTSASTAEALKGEAAPTEESADCVSSENDDYEELTSIVESMSVDDSAEAALSGCRRFCNCCRGGNRFCCKHCKWCSGPIGPYGVSTSVLAQ